MNQPKGMKKVTNKLQVWHYAQVPCKPFCVDVQNEVEAKKIMDILANQHLFLFKNNIIPDYANVITVVMWEDNSGDEGSWVSYWNEEEMMEWGEFEETYLTEIQD